MTRTFRVDSQKVVAEDIPLDAEDLRFGLERGIVDESSVIVLALEQVRRGSRDSVMSDIAALLSDEQDRVAELMSALDDPERIHDPRESSRKWRYLLLKAAFDDRERSQDPLGTVEEIYAQFDYPPSMRPFVRYMPLQSGDEAGEAALMRRWMDYLNQEHESLRRVA